MKRLIFFTVLCFGLTINVFSQTKEISSQEFYKPILAIYELKNSYRKTTKEEFYKDGKISGTIEIVDESINADKRIYLYVEKYGDKNKKTELVQIGEIYYCRINAGEWKKSDRWCANGGISGISNIISSKFTVEDVKFNNKNAKLYRQFTTFSPDKSVISYLQDNFWLNENDLIIRREIEYGGVEPKSLSSKKSEFYEYNPKDLVIEAPIK
jgi:hypothetical protein